LEREQNGDSYDAEIALNNREGFVHDANGEKPRRNHWMKGNWKKTG